MKKMKKILFKNIILLLFFTVFSQYTYGSYILIPMDEKQDNHLKSYGIAYYAIQKDISVDWLLNFQGGSFLMKRNKIIEDECNIRGVSFQIIANSQSSQILKQITSPSVNQDVVRLEKAPKIAIYSPKTNQPWDDAVTMALSYAEIPYDVIYDEEVLNNLLPMYDWLHLHRSRSIDLPWQGSLDNQPWSQRPRMPGQKISSPAHQLS